MPKVIRGTRDASGALILKGGQGGIRKIRCPACGNAAQPATVDNSPGFKCGACGTQFKAQRMA